MAKLREQENEINLMLLLLLLLRLRLNAQQLPRGVTARRWTPPPLLHHVGWLAALRSGTPWAGRLQWRRAGSEQSSERVRRGMGRRRPAAKRRTTARKGAGCGWVPVSPLYRNPPIHSPHHGAHPPAAPGVAAASSSWEICGAAWSTVGALRR